MSAPYSSKRAENSSRNSFPARAHSSSHHFKGHINVRGWKLARKLPSGGVHRQIHFTHRQSWAAISSVCRFLITVSAFSRPKPQKSCGKGHWGVLQLHVCVFASLSFAANVYNVREASFRAM
jgi:hypothetical protein